MPLPQPPRGDPLDEARIAWAESAAHLAATMRCQALHPPRLTVVPDATPCAATIAGFAIAYWTWCKLYHCACQWNLAFEVHPIFHATNWMTAAGASIIWQLYDRLNAITGGKPRVRSPRPLLPELLRVHRDHVA